MSSHFSHHRGTVRAGARSCSGLRCERRQLLGQRDTLRRQFLAKLLNLAVGLWAHDRDLADFLGFLCGNQDPLAVGIDQPGHEHTRVPDVQHLRPVQSTRGRIALRDPCGPVRVRGLCDWLALSLGAERLLLGNPYLHYRVTKRRSHIISILAVALGVVVLAGCSSGSPTAPPPGGVDLLLEEYQGAAATFPESLPPGSQFPEELPGSLPPANEAYEAGYGAS